MHTDIQTRGFALTASLINVTQSQITAFHALFPQQHVSLSIRLYDIHRHGGNSDMGCLACARINQRRISIVANDVDRDPYMAIQRAFAKLTRATRTALTKARLVKALAARKRRAAVRQAAIEQVNGPSRDTRPEAPPIMPQ